MNKLWVKNYNMGDLKTNTFKILLKLYGKEWAKNDYAKYLYKFPQIVMKPENKIYL